MDKDLSPSVFIAKALGIQKPLSETSEVSQENHHCNSCGRKIEAGEDIQRAASSEFFSSTNDLANFNGVMCWQCALMRSKKLLNALSYTLTTEKGVFKAAKNQEKASIFLNPPKPPFVLMSSTATMMHLAWRAKLTFDARRIHYRLGNYMLTVNSEKLHQLLSLIKRLKSATGSKTAFPFLFGKINDTTFGKVNPKISYLFNDKDHELIANMSPGDIAASYSLTGNNYEKIKPLEEITHKIIENIYK